MGNYFKAKSANQIWLKLRKEFLRINTSIQSESRSGNTRELLHTFLSIENPKERWITSRYPPLIPLSQ